MKHRNSHLLVGYWSRMRRGREVPDQGDIDPRAIKRMLPYVFILDARDPTRPIYRLAGTVLCERFGLELRGASFFGHWEAQARGALVLLLKQAFAMKQPVCLSAIGTTSHCAVMEMETVLAPITYGNGAPNRFLGIVQFLSDAAQLGGRPIAYERLIGSKMIREDEPNDTASHPPPPAANGPHKTPHLRLVVSRDGPAALHFDMDATMRKVVAALDVKPSIGLVR